jgi:hypothetical protein
MRSILHLTPFELRFGCKLFVFHLRPFGCKCFVLKCDNLDKFESHSSDGILLQYTILMAWFEGELVFYLVYLYHFALLLYFLYIQLS